MQKTGLCALAVALSAAALIISIHGTMETSPDTETQTAGANLTGALHSTVYLNTPRQNAGGIVWDENTIITSAHLVASPFNHLVAQENITVHTYDGKKHTARTIWFDPYVDIALLRTENMMPFVRAEMPSVGSRVYGIGAPFSFEFSVSEGIISHQSRILPTAYGYMRGGMFQTDTLLLPGNSGGPIIDAEGRLVGMATAIHTLDENIGGIGFGIRTDMLEYIMERYENGWRPACLGASIQNSHITDVQIDGPVGSILDIGDHVRIGGFSDTDDIINHIAYKTPGDLVEIWFERNGADITMDVPLGEFGTSFGIATCKKHIS